MVGTLIQAEKVKLLANLKHAQNALFEDQQSFNNGEYLSHMNNLQSTYNDLISNKISDDCILNTNKNYLKEMNKSQPIPIVAPPMNLSLTFEVLNFIEG